MEFRVLGSIEASVGGRSIEIGARMQRIILAALLVEALWPGSRRPPPQPPSTATSPASAAPSNRTGRPAPRPASSSPSHPATGCRSSLRPSTPPDSSTSPPPGRAHLLAGRHQDARTVLQQALAQWRGLPYADLASEAFLQPEIARLGELRAACTDDFMETLVALGHRASAVPELERLAAAEPQPERRRELVARALSGSGRHGDAVEAAAPTPTTLVNRASRPARRWPGWKSSTRGRPS